MLTNLSLTIFLFPFFLWSLSNQSASIHITQPAVISTILIGAASIGFFGCIQLAVQNLSAGTASLSTLVGPEFAALVGIVFYHERLSFLLICSLVLSIGGVLLSTSAESKTLLSKMRQKKIDKEPQLAQVET